MEELVIGVHSGHDSSACIIRGNKIVRAIAKERITRKKHDSGDPIECVEYILEAEGLKKSDIDLLVRCNWFDSNELRDEYYNDFKKVIINRSHHMFHAYAATLVAAATPCIIVVQDGRGCRPEDDDMTEVEVNRSKNEAETKFEAESIYFYDGKELKVLEKLFKTHYKNKFQWGSHLDSLGYAYAAVSRSIFSDYNAAGKIMALASYGNENRAIPVPFIYGKKTEFHINPDWLNLINKQRIPIFWQSQLAKDLAYSVQTGLENYMQFLIKKLVDKYKINNFCLGGGVALNCKNNGILANKPYVDKIGIFPACGDDGLSIGAAIWGYRFLTNSNQKIEWKFGLGKNYIKNRTFNYDQSAKKIALALKENKYVGIYTRESEYGPRALGNRSIFANASNLTSREYLNKNIKCREPFRPFGGIILRENLSILTDEKLASKYMLSAVQIKKSYRKNAAALIHVDGTIRLQVVDDTDSLAARILKEYQRLTGNVVLLNTSFNAKGEAIVETRDHAINTAKNIGLDYLIIEDEIIKLDGAKNV